VPRGSGSFSAGGALLASPPLYGCPPSFLWSSPSFITRFPISRLSLPPRPPTLNFPLATIPFLPTLRLAAFTRSRCLVPGGAPRQTIYLRGAGPGTFTGKAREFRTEPALYSSEYTEDAEEERAGGCGRRGRAELRLPLWMNRKEQSCLVTRPPGVEPHIIMF